MPAIRRGLSRTIREPPGDTWWATSIDLDVSGETQDLTDDDRTVYVDFRLTDAAGHKTVRPDERITWKVTTVGEVRTETRYKTVDGETVDYEVTVTDHLVQTREKMIIAAERNAGTRLPITRSDPVAAAFIIETTLADRARNRLFCYVARRPLQCLSARVSSAC
ncbi:MAG: hypothetical protein ACOC8H_00245 [bacterium]